MAHGKKKKSPGEDLKVDSSKAPSVVFNDKFRTDIPFYFIDSGVVITFGLIKILREAGLKDPDIKNAIIRGSRKTVNGEPIEGNWKNIDTEGAEKLMQIYNDNQNGKCAICIVPAVYKETMLDGLAHDDTRRQFTRKFVKENCFLAFPNESLATFARKTAVLQEKLKTCVSANGVFGLNPEFRTKKNKETGERFLVDVNFEDRLILAQTAVIAKQGLIKVTFMSCSKLNESMTASDVKNIHSLSLALNDTETNEKPTSGNGIKIVYVQINSKDFGKHGSSRRGKGIVGKNDVAEQIDEVLEDYFQGDGEVVVATPNDLGKSF